MKFILLKGLFFCAEPKPQVVAKKNEADPAGSGFDHDVQHE
jgi:hypothetical protein